MNIECSYSKLEDLHKLVPHPRNSNKHPEEQIRMLANIIDHIGFRHPIIVSKLSGFIVSGHGRLDAAKYLKYKTVPVEYQDFENEAEEFAFLIADNKIAELSEHDDNIMISGIKDLNIEEFELLGLSNFNLELHNAWDSDIESVNKIDENLDGIIATIKITCPQELKDEVLIYLKSKLMETSFEGVHIE